MDSPYTFISTVLRVPEIPAGDDTESICLAIRTRRQLYYQEIARITAELERDNAIIQRLTPMNDARNELSRNSVERQYGC